MEETKQENIDFENLFIGNLWKWRDSSPEATNRHCWIMFVSTTPSDIIPPTTVKSVKYELHPSYIHNKLTMNQSPFILRRCGWGTFTIGAKISFKNNRKTIFVKYPLQFGVPLTSMSLQDNSQIYTDKLANVDEILKRVDRKSPVAFNSFVSKTGPILQRHLENLKPPIVLEDFSQTPETVVEIVGMFFDAYGLQLPEEILRMIVDFSAPYVLRPNAHQAGVNHWM